MSSIKGIRQRLENLFAGVADAIPATGPLGRTAIPRNISRLHGWVWELDLDGAYTWSSPEIERILGYSQDEIQGKSFHSVGFKGEVAETVRSHLEEGSQIQQLIVQAQHKDGQSFQILIRAMHRVDSTGEPLGFRGVSQLVDSEAMIPERLVVEVPTPPEEIGATTPPTFAPSWGTIYGFEDEEGEIQPLKEAQDPRVSLSEDREGLLVIPLQVQDEVIGVIELESSDDGGPWRDEDRALANAIAHELAITLQDARSYQLTQQALEEMREADRLKSQFLANMSHELRTPLNSIIGFSRVILKGIDGPITDPQEQDLNAIYNAGQHLLGLINNILDISKIEAGKMELAFTDVDLSEIIRGVMATAVGLVKDKPIELITDIPEQLPFVQADNIRIRQVLLNLVSNAAKFTEEGHIGVSARTIQRGSRNEVVIAVFDTGPGIDQEDQERIFEPFSQVDASPTRKTGGTGLGLSISRHLVELHGGVIWVESIPDEGSTFAFTLPFDPELQFTRTTAPLILGIDHDPASLLQYRESLETSGFRFHALSRPNQTAEVAKALQPQAIVIDMFDSGAQTWQLLQSIATDPVLRSTPTLLTDYDERSDTGILLPVRYWLSRATSSEEICATLEMLAPSSSSKPSVVVLDEEGSPWSEIIASVEALHRVDLQIIKPIEQLQDLLHENLPDMILLNLTLLESILVEIFVMLEETSNTAKLPILGLLPDDSMEEETQVVKDMLASWREQASTKRETHLESVVTFLQTSVPPKA
jgi:PAS domain S-box-containing protein